MSDEITANRKAEALRLIEDLIDWSLEFSRNIMEPDDLGEPEINADWHTEALAAHLDYLGLLLIARRFRFLSEKVFTWHDELALSHPMHDPPDEFSFGSREDLLKRLRKFVSEMINCLREAKGILGPSTNSQTQSEMRVQDGEDGAANCREAVEDTGKARTSGGRKGRRKADKMVELENWLGLQAGAGKLSDTSRYGFWDDLMEEVPSHVRPPSKDALRRAWKRHPLNHNAGESRT